MQPRWLIIAAAFGLIGAAPMEAPLPPLAPWHGDSEKLIVRASDPWITPAEAAGFRTTPSYADTVAWLRKLAAESPLMKIETFGQTPQGRDMIAVLASHGDGVKRPVLLVQAGIHAGEIDGKDAGLMLLRDIALRDKRGLLDKADLLFVPIFNIDGHERVSRFNRPNQRGPENQGWRTTAQNLNLNRDYLKADAPEMRAMIALIRKYDPSLYLDMHVTDGTDHQYDVAYSFPGFDGRYAQSPAIGRWLDTRFRGAIDAQLKAGGHMPGLYVDAVDEHAPEKGIRHNADTPRFSTGYGDLRHLPTVLVETLALRPYRQRVIGTYVLVAAALKLVGDDKAALASAIAADRAARPTTMVAVWKEKKEPVATIDFLSIAHETYASPASGRNEIRWLGRPVTIRIPVLGQEPDITVKLPRAWWVPATKPDVIERLRLHGVAFETITVARTVRVDMVRLSDVKIGAANEGHIPLGSASYAHARRDEAFPAGSVRVPSDQPLRLIAAALLEPENPDSMLAWGYFPEILQRTEYMERYAIAPLADRMLASDAALQTEFAARLAADPAFAQDAERRLAWFYERTPYFDARYLLYPIGRELP